MDIKFKKKDKNLLLQDLCSRLLYGIRCSFGVDDAIYEITGLNPSSCGASEIQATHIKSGINGDFTISSCKPYLFPLSSMTEEQRREYTSLLNHIMTIEGDVCDACTVESINWLLENHFDVNNLIPKDLAKDATGLNIY